MKPAIPYLVVVILTAAAMFLLMRGCSPSPSHQQDKAAVDSVVAVFQAYKSAAEAHDDTLETVIMLKQDTIDNLSHQMAWYEATLSNEGEQINQTTDRMDSARAHSDTIPFVLSCDTLEGQVKIARGEAILFRGTADSLVKALVQQGQLKDSVAASWKSAFMHADTAQAFLQSKYSSLYTDYTKQQKKKSVTTKVLGGAAAALLLGLLIKK